MKKEKYPMPIGTPMGLPSRLQIPYLQPVPHVVPVHNLGAVLLAVLAQHVPTHYHPGSVLLHHLGHSV